MDPPASRERFLAVARIARPRGRRGEVAAEVLTDFPERLEQLRRVWLAEPEGASEGSAAPASGPAGWAPRGATIERAWPHKGQVILKFEGVDSIDAADGLRGLHVLVLREDRVALPDHSYYVWELVGCQVVIAGQGQSGELVGAVTTVEPTGGVPNLRVARPNGGEVLIPLAQEICIRIDVATKKIVVSPPDGLLDLNEMNERR